MKSSHKKNLILFTPGFQNFQGVGRGEVTKEKDKSGENIMQYEEFLSDKKYTSQSAGFEISKDKLNTKAFNWQKDIITWSLKKGKSSLFEDCGLGKTLQQSEWGKQIHEAEKGDILILAPLAVSKQTKSEGEKFGIEINICRTQDDVKPGINITNYEMLEHFNPNKFIGVVLDESSILKSYDGRFRNLIIDYFKDTPYKLACTATPAPNDFMELGNHAEFMNVMSRSEMLATFFTHDGGETSKWRLKGHAEEKFWEWVASWAVVLSNPADLGYYDEKYNLPPLNIQEHIVKSPQSPFSLLPDVAKTLSERRQARKESINERVDRASELANNSNEQWIVWCDLNQESEMLTKSIKDAVEVKGSDSNEHKEDSMLRFSNGDIRCLVTKPSIAGWGMNWQNCHNMSFVGLSDSYEAFYQSVRRCWRFGQEKEVNSHIIVSEREGAVKANIERKEADSKRMFQEMIKHTKNILTQEIRGTVRQSIDYNPQFEMILPEWLGVGA